MWRSCLVLPHAPLLIEFRASSPPYTLSIVSSALNGAFSTFVLEILHTCCCCISSYALHYISSPSSIWGFRCKPLKWRFSPSTPSIYYSASLSSALVKIVSPSPATNLGAHGATSQQDIWMQAHTWWRRCGWSKRW